MAPQGIQDRYTHTHTAGTKKAVKMKVQKHPHPQREPNQSTIQIKILEKKKYLVPTNSYTQTCTFFIQNQNKIM